CGRGPISGVVDDSSGRGIGDSHVLRAGVRAAYGRENRGGNYAERGDGQGSALECERVVDGGESARGDVDGVSAGQGTDGCGGGLSGCAGENRRRISIHKAGRSIGKGR